MNEIEKLSSSAENWYFDNWCGHSLEYLDDRKCAKAFPSSYDREWFCPIVYDEKHVNVSDFDIDKHLSYVNVDTSLLADVVTNGASVCAVLTKRLQSDSGATLYHKYFCAGESSRDVPSETWSSSKIFAMENAAGHLRTGESSCQREQAGLDSDSYGNMAPLLWVT